MSVLVQLKEFFDNFKGEKSIIGRSFLRKPIYCFKVQKSQYPKIICQYSIHAREYITTYLAMEQIKDFAMHGKRGTIFFLPATNPDGIEICEQGDLLYKANARGVDLNVNFDARWGTGKENVLKKGGQNYIGKRPFSEVETKLLRDFTLKVNPDATISYHSKGEEIYYQFFQEDKEEKRDRYIAEQIEKVTGYKIKLTPNSAGGYKDWCIERLKIPAFTIEVGRDELSHPIGKEHLEDIYKKCRGVSQAVIDALERLCKTNL
ncbi:MAG: hypothetical protein IJC07_02235 [Clostridia bacterium]|nr:hypothetical protein [Clostridia bacterium]